ncbi:MAG: hypothetical protein IIC83_09930 [Chloroflexi bacterium]|nr:hypothetical protein [Chloroflexota bacterium]
MPSKISFFLESEDPRRISVNSLRSALDGFSNLLGEVEREISHTSRRTLSWDITDIRFGSALVQLEALPTGQQEVELTSSVIEATFLGLESIITDPSRPEYFNDEALEWSRRITRILGDGISRITVSIDNGSKNIHITEHLAGNVRQILQSMEAYGSIEGYLDVLSSRSATLHFSVRESLTNRIVRCNFDEDLVEQALEAWRKRVIVFGRIQADNRGNPRTLWVWTMNVIKGPSDIPSIDDVEGVSEHITGGLPPEEYVRRRYGQ